MRPFLLFFLCLFFVYSLPLHAQFPREIRAVWLTTLSGLDWPSRTGTSDAVGAQQKAELCQMLDRLQTVGINVVLFQARVRGTVDYPSAIEPWDGGISGRAGTAPAFDPLGFAVEECHRRGMECHAWVVAFPVCKVGVAKALGQRALPARHPELVQRCGDQWMMDPGVPGTAPYVAALCKEIAERYDVDGIHLDYIRYPESGIPFNDDRTYRRYGAGRDRQTWRTENVTRVVRQVAEAVRGVKPWLKMSCSPVGKYADLARYSSSGWNARDAVCQDAQAWLREGLMDWLFPMMYFDGRHYYPFAADWRENDAGRIVCPGLGIYFLNPAQKDWPLQTVQRQINVARALGLGGLAYFRAKFLLRDEKGLYSWLLHAPVGQSALVPPMTWADSIPPAAPVVRQRLDGLRLRLDWDAVRDDTPVTYNVYRLDSLYGNRILATRLRSTHYECTLALPALRHSRYVVSAVDAYGNEQFAE